MEMSLHFQNTGWGSGFGASIVKLINPPIGNPFPGMRVIGRVFAPDYEINALAAEGKAGAIKWFNRQLPMLESRTYVHAWEDINEPPTGDRTYRLKLVEFTATWSELMYRRGWQTVVYNLASGNPEIGNGKDLKAGLGCATYLGLHEYWNNMDADYTWTWCRYRRLLDELGVAPPILITECGISNRAGDSGYHNRFTDDQYLEQLDRYATELAKDNVVAAFVFTATPSHPWFSFEVSEEFSRRMKVHYPSAPPILPVEGPTIEHIAPSLPHGSKQYLQRSKNKIDTTILHYSWVKPPTPKDTLAQIASIARGHIRLGWPGIAYHYCVGVDGTIYQVNPLTSIAYHAGKWNARSVGICCLLRDSTPTEEQVVAIAKLVKWLGYPLKLHKEVAQTSCPGKFLGPLVRARLG
jgi:hypothetical protein